ncbi:hypothetical protein ABZ580_30870 [Streptomyces sp. NPDC012486]|uniref:hypothetical protein n=1 Tax=unclassified Streptomyces TaxID=2593676 RepID=UPI0033C046E5
MAENSGAGRRAERIYCDDCQVGPGPDNSRTITSGLNGMTEIWHSPDCPQEAITMILREDSARRVNEQTAWAKEHFPAAHLRLTAAAQALDADTASAPFVRALTELVQAQADTTGMVTLHTWATILERHFPAAQPEPDQGG